MISIWRASAGFPRLEVWGACRYVGFRIGLVDHNGVVWRGVVRGLPTSAQGGYSEKTAKSLMNPNVIGNIAPRRTARHLQRYRTSTLHPRGGGGVP